MTRQKLLPPQHRQYQYKEQDPQYYGQQLPQQYAQGPTQNRPCTDILCCIIFVIFLCAMGFVAYLGFTTGDPRYLALPFDQSGNQCKYASGYEDFEKIFISSYYNDPRNITFVCVKQCPASQSAVINCKTNKFVSNCNQLISYSTKTIVNLCMPIDQIALLEYQNYLDISTLQKYFSDIQIGWPIVAGTLLISLIMSLIYTVIIRLCAGVFIWSGIILAITFEILCGFFIFFVGQFEFLKEIVHYDDLPQNFKDREYQIIAASIIWGVALISILVVCCMVRQIKISIGIIKAASDFTRSQCLVFLIPIIGMILQVLFLIFWIIVMLFLFSSNKQIEQISGTPFGWIVWNEDIKRITIFYLFGLCWIVSFFGALSCYWVSATVAIWYFARGETTVPLLKSFYFSFKNVGSLAMGSFIVGLVMFIRIVLEFIHAKFKKDTLNLQDKVPMMKICLKMVSCCLACFQRLVRFLTENAYIMIAISGKNFCASAQQSFYLMVRSAAQYAISHGTTKIFITIGKIFIVVFSGFIGYLLITQIDYYRHQIYSPVFMTIAFIIVSYPVAAAFMDFFEMAANTLLMCYCLELDLAKGTNPRCPQVMRRFLSEYISSITSQDDD